MYLFQYNYIRDIDWTYMKIIKNLQKIVIVGGGSAGWMTAAMLIKFFPKHHITVIESPDHPILGVGESTLLGIRNYCNYLGINESDFMKHTDASYKMSIKFTDFYEKDSGGFHYPFGVATCSTKSINTFEDWFVKRALYPNISNDDFARSYYPNAALYEQNKFTDNKHGKFGEWDPKYHVAYHFDATKFGIWLRENYCLPKGVNIIKSSVEDAEVDEDGIKSLLLTTGEKITSDLFVDCTGFKSLLLGNYLKEEFISYSDMLPNNRAWATRMPYKDKQKELEPYTNSTAIGNGWVWNIPSWERIGTGYVYSDRYTSSEAAKEELKQHLMSDKMPCPRTREEVDALEFKDIPMRVGIHRRTFVKNVVAIGLSAGFIEPLESNGLFSVHEFLAMLVKTLLSGSVNQFDIDTYNRSTRHLFQNFSEFVALHYAFSKRNDTEYWKANNARVYDKNMTDLIPTEAVGFVDYTERKMFHGQFQVNKGMIWIATGMNHHIVDEINVLEKEWQVGKPLKSVYAESFTAIEMNKARWWKAAESELSLCDWLAKYVHTS
jgi:tryptophan halogenase